MATGKAKRIYRDFTPAELARWQRAVAESEAEREEIIQRGREILAARRKGAGQGDGQVNTDHD
jgi:hypothetical protein